MDSRSTVDTVSPRSNFKDQAPSGTSVLLISLSLSAFVCLSRLVELTHPQLARKQNNRRPASGGGYVHRGDLFCLSRHSQRSHPLKPSLQRSTVTSPTLGCRV